MQAIFQVLYIPHGQCRCRTFLSLHKVLLDHSGLDWTAGMRVERNRRIWEMLGGDYVWFGDGLAMGHAQDGVSRFRPRLLAMAKVELLAQRSECFDASGFRTWYQRVSHGHQQPKKAPILRQPPGTADCLLKNLQLCICLLSNPPSLGV